MVVVGGCSGLERGILLLLQVVLVVLTGEGEHQAVVEEVVEDCRNLNCRLLL